jgi:DNA-binding transcriptional LysR family regulator
MESGPDLHRLNLNRLDLNKLETFFAVAEAGGVSAAARRLALTRSAVSHSLGALETALGVALFHRVGRRLVPTPEGRRLHRRFAEIRERLAEALGEATAGDVGVRGPVRIGLFLGFSRFRLSRVLERFLREHPAAQVRVTYGSQAELVEQLRSGALDFTLSLRSVGREARQIRSRRLFDQTLVLAAPAASTAAPRRAAVAWLAATPVVDYYRGSPLIDRWTRHHFGRRIPRDRVRVWAASTDLVLELVRSGVGVGVLPGDLVEPFHRRRELALVAGPRKPLRDSLWLNELAGARPTQTRAVFRSVLLEAAEAG